MAYPSFADLALTIVRRCVARQRKGLSGLHRRARLRAGARSALMVAGQMSAARNLLELGIDHAVFGWVLR
ncbi:hypothetical protein GCM10009106_22690 [Sphingomonas japonica]